MHPDQFNRLMKAIGELDNKLSLLNKYRCTEQLIDTHELTVLLGISKRTAQTWRETAVLPYMQLGRKIFYRLTDLENLFDQQISRKFSHRKFSNAAPRKQVPIRKSGNGFTIKVGRSKQKASLHTGRR